MPSCVVVHKLDQSLLAYLGCPEVAQLHHAAVVDEDVAALDVAMNNSFSVEIEKPLKDLLCVTGYPPIGERSEVYQQGRDRPRYPLLKYRYRLFAVVYLIRPGRKHRINMRIDTSLRASTESE